jgi:hypothetical protein
VVGTPSPMTILVALLLGGCSLLRHAAAGSPYQPVLPATQPFVAGVDGYRLYRIPSLLRLQNGDFLLFCEARGPMIAGGGGAAQQSRSSTTDGGPTDIVTRRSTDGGRSWGKISVVHSETTPSKVGGGRASACGLVRRGTLLHSVPTTCVAPSQRRGRKGGKTVDGCR